MNKTPVCITWRDIATWAGWNEELVESGLAEPLTVQTVGFIIKKTKDILLISDTYPEIGSVTAFPAGCVVKIEKLDGKKPSKGGSPAGE